MRIIKITATTGLMLLLGNAQSAPFTKRGVPSDCDAPQTASTKPWIGVDFCASVVKNY